MSKTDEIEIESAFSSPSNQEGKRRNVYVLVANLGVYPTTEYADLYKIKMDQRDDAPHNKLPPPVPVPVPVQVHEPVARFFQEGVYTGPRFYTLNGVNIDNKLYLLLSSASTGTYSDDDGAVGRESTDDEDPFPKRPDPLDSYVLDLKTGALDKFRKSKAEKSSATVVYAHEKIYFLLDPCIWPRKPSDAQDSFERYDPSKDTWETLKSFPYSAGWSRTRIDGHAVIEDTILF